MPKIIPVDVFDCVVFGATGYIGARLVPQLLSAGHDVRVMARKPAKLDEVPWRRDVEVVEGDVTNGNCGLHFTVKKHA